MIIDKEAFLEHYGVKGMQWGVRRARTSESSTSSPRQVQVKKERNRMLRNAAIGTAGAGVAAYLIAKNSNKKIGLATKEVNIDKHIHNAARLRQALGNQPVSTAKPKSTILSDAGDLAKMRAHAMEAVKEANAQLRARDNEFNIPFPERSYLKEWI